MKKILLLLPIMVIGIVFSGCAVKQKVGLTYNAQAVLQSTESHPKVSVSVNDKRTYVLDGNKKGSFIGYYRSGVGIPYAVNTQNNIPLATLLEGDLNKELSALGFVGKDGSKSLEVDIVAWKFDAYQTAQFDYTLDVKVLDAAKKEIAISKISDNITIPGTFWAGGKGGVERDMPKLYIAIIKKLVRENAEIFKALK